MYFVYTPGHFLFNKIMGKKSYEAPDTDRMASLHPTRLYPLLNREPEARESATHAPA